MFGLLTKKELDEHIGKLLRQMEKERWALENEQDRFSAKLKDLQERVAILEDRHLGGLMTPEEAEEQMKKRVDANRYARQHYRKQKAKKDASSRTPSL